MQTSKKHKFGHRYNFYIDTEDYEKIKRLASKEGLEVAQWIRMRLKYILRSNA